MKNKEIILLTINKFLDSERPEQFREWLIQNPNYRDTCLIFFPLFTYLIEKAK